MSFFFFLSRFALTAKTSKHYSTITALSTHQQHYINQLNQSLTTNHQNQQQQQQLTPAAVNQILNHLHSNQLFTHLPTTTYDSLLDLNPANQLENTLSANYYLYNHIFFLLDRIHERKHQFSKNQLDRFHSIALKRLAHAGLFKPAELIWDQLISTPHPDDQILMLHCIRTAIINHHDSHLTTQHQNQHQHQHQELQPLSPKDLKRMMNLTDSIATTLTSSSSTGTTPMDEQTERWAVRTVAEIYALQGERKRLTEWLAQRRGLDLDFPDNGACWSDPKLTAMVVRMFKEQGRLDKMMSIYEAALHPSPSMLAHPSSSFRTIFESSPSTLADPPQPVVSRKRDGSRARTHPILTRTYHDLISACVHANRPHLAIHYLTVAVEDTEAYVERLPEVPRDVPSVPHLRLQPATYAELVPSLVRKKRDTQLRTVYALSERLVQSTVRELQWIRLLATRRSACADPDEEGDGHPWNLVLAAIVPDLAGGQAGDMEAAKAENLGLEKAVFTHHSQPASIDPPPSRSTTSSCLDDPARAPLDARHAKNELGFLRTLERTKFLSRTLAHSLRLLQRLRPLILKTRLNRDIRFQLNLLKKSKNQSPGRVLSSPSSSNSPHLKSLARFNNLIHQKKSLRLAPP